MQEVTKGRASGSGHVIYSRPLHSELHNQPKDHHWNGMVRY